ncbi:S24 family peptidase [Candidatus Kapabacteria bacterium]|nr:S24 family peptidase [Candidatus Kapabacteria bacterium]
MNESTLNKIKEASAVEPFQASTNSSVSLPMIDEPANAGTHLPFMNDDLFAKSMDLNDEYINQPANNFIFKVSGDSMSPEIENESLVVVDTLKQCESGNVIIVALDGSLLIKRYIEENGHTLLRSSNINYEDIILTEFTDVKIWGVVVSIHRKI